MCGTATVLAQDAPDVWHCHVSRASNARCVALPRFPCKALLSGYHESINGTQRRQERDVEEYKREFIDFMVESDVLKFGKFTLKSGRKSPSS
jgi:hypothetical protein